MTEREEIINSLNACMDVHRSGLWSSGCAFCSYAKWRNPKCFMNLIKDVIELLKQPEDKELHLDDLDALVNMIAIKAKAEGRFFSPYEVGLALVAHGQHDERFKWGEVIKYSPSEVERILNEVMKDD